MLFRTDLDSVCRIVSESAVSHPHIRFISPTPRSLVLILGLIGFMPGVLGAESAEQRKHNAMKHLAAGVPLEPGERDDFPTLIPKLSDPAVAGIIIGSPVYFGNMSSLCKAFLERLMVFRKDNYALSNVVAGVSFVR